MFTTSSAPRGPPSPCGLPAWDDVFHAVGPNATKICSRQKVWARPTALAWRRYLTRPALISTRPIPCDHGYHLYAAVSRVLPSLHQPGSPSPSLHPTSGIAIHPIRGQQIGGRKLAVEQVVAFQSAPPAKPEGNVSVNPSSVTSSYSFNPPPGDAGGERSVTQTNNMGNGFQSAPPAKPEGNNRRGETSVVPVCFNPPPRRSRRGTIAVVVLTAPRANGFNPPPRRSRRGNGPRIVSRLMSPTVSIRPPGEAGGEPSHVPPTCERITVSIRPPGEAGGEPGGAAVVPRACRFNPPPGEAGGELVHVVRAGRDAEFQSAPPAKPEGNSSASALPMGPTPVSIRPPGEAGGERGAGGRFTNALRFQSAPPAKPEGNHVNGRQPILWCKFQSAPPAKPEGNRNQIWYGHKARHVSIRPPGEAGGERLAGRPAAGAGRVSIRPPGEAGGERSEAS